MKVELNRSIDDDEIIEIEELVLAKNQDILPEETEFLSDLAGPNGSSTQEVDKEFMSIFMDWAKSQRKLIVWLDDKIVLDNHKGPLDLDDSVKPGLAKAVVEKLLSENSKRSAKDWRAMFDQINLDCEKDGDRDVVHPINTDPETVEYYAQQIQMIGEDEGVEYSDGEAMALAQEVCSLA